MKATAVSVRLQIYLCALKYTNNVNNPPQGQETHLQAFFTVDSKSVHDQGPKGGITWIADSPSSMSGVQMDKMVFIPTLYYIPRGPTPKEEGPLNSGGWSAPYPRRSVPLSHSTASPLDNMQRSTSVSHPRRWLSQCQGGLIHGQGEGVTRIATVVME